MAFCWCSLQCWIRVAVANLRRPAVALLQNFPKVTPPPTRCARQPLQVLLLAMLEPRSYTAEDVIEVHTHGGGLSAQRVLQACLEAGARLAQPGEFTLRAFLNGRLDLSQAESVAQVRPGRGRVGCGGWAECGMPRRASAHRHRWLLRLPACRGPACCPRPPTRCPTCCRPSACPRAQLIDARTVAAADSALAGLAGGLGRQVAAMRQECVDILVELDAR